MKRSSTSKQSSNGTRKKAKANEPRDLRKAFAPGLLKKAKEIADQYAVVLEPHPRLGFLGTSVEFPTVFTHAKSATGCVKKTREALMVAVAVMLEMGDDPPAAAREELRNQQINIRLTAKERLLLESAAKRHGFRGLSDFVRTAALSHVRKSA